jgi:DNA-binding CsgD family transcriptional regulator
MPTRMPAAHCVRQTAKLPLSYKGGPGGRSSRTGNWSKGIQTPGRRWLRLLFPTQLRLPIWLHAAGQGWWQDEWSAPDRLRHRNCAARRCADDGTTCLPSPRSKPFRRVQRAGRQQQILQLINEGLSNKQIAQRLSLGISTVKNHVHGLLGRLQVGRRSDAVARLGRSNGPD